MVVALLAGRKTQTRRLATSPLRRCAPGDRLYVREAWRTGLAYEDLAPSAMGGEEPVLFESDGTTKRWSAGSSEPGRLRPSMHMPRWASRLTLIVEEVRVEPLKAISREDAIAEGMIHKPGVIEPDWWMLPEPHHQGSFLSPVAAYRWLWNDLHTKLGERWEDNPAVVALTFRVMHGNVDQAPAGSRANASAGPRRAAGSTAARTYRVARHGSRCRAEAAGSMLRLVQEPGQPDGPCTARGGIGERRMAATNAARGSAVERQPDSLPITSPASR